MQINVKTIESKPDKVKIFFDAFAMGQEAARKVWGE